MKKLYSLKEVLQVNGRMSLEILMHYPPSVLKRLSILDAITFTEYLSILDIYQEHIVNPDRVTGIQQLGPESLESLVREKKEVISKELNLASAAPYTSTISVRSYVYLVPALMLGVAIGSVAKLIFIG